MCATSTDTQSKPPQEQDVGVKGEKSKVAWREALFLGVGIRHTYRQKSVEKNLFLIKMLFIYL